MNKKKVFVGMSGGVDSSVAAYLLKKQGYEAIGVYMRCYNLDGCSEQDSEDARRVAEQLGIPFYVWDFEQEYKERVVRYMVEGYRRGETPNPDVECNREIKFGLFFERAMKLGADYVATGHYVKLKVRRQKTKVEYGLFEARDKNKDQSYFLWTLLRKQLAHCLFPIGEYTKPQVRAIAERAHLVTAGKKDSQGICFLGQVGLEDFLKRYLPKRKGEVRTTRGEKAGEHSGAWFYTIGQRHGLGLGGKNKELRIKGRTETKAHYVVSKNVRTNTVVVAEGSDDPELYRKEVVLRSVSFINPIPKTPRPILVLARIRYRQPLVPAELVVARGGKRPVTRLVFQTPVKFVARGQSAVFYARSGQMIGGGVIR